MAKKYVYYFGSGKAEGKATMKELLGGKGANLAEMCLIGLPVPAGFTVTTECCVDYFKAGGKYAASLAAEVKAALKKVERDMGMVFGDPKNPQIGRASCRERV
jgi:pyruvate,orthophosphate dikinase